MKGAGSQGPTRGRGRHPGAALRAYRLAIDAIAHLILVWLDSATVDRSAGRLAGARGNGARISVGSDVLAERVSDRAVNPLRGKRAMGVMKFRLPSNDPAQRASDYRKAYITGLDRTPGRVGVELRNGLMTCIRETTESGRLFVPWPIDGHGTPIVGTATLAERPAPYVLAVELARGKLNDVRNQLADWTQMGLRSTPELERALDEAQRAFIRAATSADQPEAAWRRPRASLDGLGTAGDLLIEAYTAQVLQSRLAADLAGSRPTWAASWTAIPRRCPAALDWPRTFNAVPGRRLVEADRPLGGAVPLGPARRPAGLVPPQPAGDRGRPADRVPPRRPARLALALGGRLRDDQRPGRRLRPAGRHALPGQDPALARGAPARPAARSSASPRRSRSGSPPGPSRSPARPTPPPS